MGYEFSVAKFFESKPRSRFFGSLARAHVGARTFWRAQKVAFSLRKNPIAPRLCVPHQTLRKDFDRRRREPQRIYFQNCSEPRLFCLWRARAIFWVVFGPVKRTRNGFNHELRTFREYRPDRNFELEKMLATRAREHCLKIMFLMKYWSKIPLSLIRIAGGYIYPPLSYPHMRGVSYIPLSYPRAGGPTIWGQ